MREIKFRVWNTFYKVWHYVDIRDFFMGFGSLDNDEYDLKHGTISQYTGLKDKNGKELYEGDIYKHGNSVLTVVWSNFGFVGYDIKTSEYWCLNRLHQKYYEIISNIHAEDIKDKKEEKDEY